MRNAMKVARWELKRNLKNKSFIIGLFLTPAILAFFMIVPSLFSSDEGVEDVHLFVKDELDVFPLLEDMVTEEEWDHITIEETVLDHDTVLQNVFDESGTAYLEISEEHMAKGAIPLYVNDDINEAFMFQISILEEPIRNIQLDRLGLSNEEIEIISQGVSFDVTYADELDEESSIDRKSTRLNSSHVAISYAVFCLKKKINNICINNSYK